MHADRDKQTERQTENTDRPDRQTHLTQIERLTDQTDRTDRQTDSDTDKQAKNTCSSNC